MASIQQAFNAFFPSHHSSAVFLSLCLFPRSPLPATHVDLILAYFQLPSYTQFVNISLSLLYSRTSTLQTPSLSGMLTRAYYARIFRRPLLQTAPCKSKCSVGAHSLVSYHHDRRPSTLPQPSWNTRRPRRTSPSSTRDAGASSRNADGAIDGEVEAPLVWVVMATAGSCDGERIDSRRISRRAPGRRGPSPGTSRRRRCRRGLDV
ncbi:hypothetical protein BD626DRAFT_32296 [Schizophyllum amplum]|uniref:Uncharacterized protein n=1 Tax=Schizophyllum amplum TaxID=97359 RepID=A0A550CE47_9AGAR|nr:hypothetical protein BD626DRAFT_32296 [Auriculariopsis ampla]